MRNYSHEQGPLLFLPHTQSEAVSSVEITALLLCEIENGHDSATKPTHNTLSSFPAEGLPDDPESPRDPFGSGISCDARYP
jgi:hypothetical protein